MHAGGNLQEGSACACSEGNANHSEQMEKCSKQYISRKFHGTRMFGGKGATFKFQSAFTAGGKSDINRHPRKTINWREGRTVESMPKIVSTIAPQSGSDESTICNFERTEISSNSSDISITKIDVAGRMSIKGKCGDAKYAKSTMPDYTEERGLTGRMPVRLAYPNAAHSIFAPSENSNSKRSSMKKDYGDFNIFGVESPNNSLLKFGDEEGEREEKDDESSNEDALTVDPKQVNGQGRLLLVSLLENFCDLYDQDPDKNRRLFLALCRRLSSMGV